MRCLNGVNENTSDSQLAPVPVGRIFALLQCLESDFVMPHHAHPFPYFFYFAESISERHTGGALLPIHWVNMKLPCVAEMNMVHVDENHTLSRIFLASHSRLLIIARELVGCQSEH